MRWPWRHRNVRRGPGKPGSGRGALAALAMAFLLSACAATPQSNAPGTRSGVQVAGFLIRNALVYTVHDVMVEVPATGGFAGCGQIMPRTECRSAIAAVDYRQHEIVVSWREHGEAQATDPFIVELPTGLGPEDTVWLEVVIYAPGLAGARFVQP